MLTKEFIADLRQIVGDEHVSESRADAELYSYDGSLARGTPGVVVFPADTGEAAAVVRCAHTAGVAFVPRGFGTNLSGGTVMPSGGLVVCLTRLNRILEIHPERRCAVVQPGVTNLELQNALAAIDFFYAPDPASQKVATIGGNTGENSGGPHCLKYGVTTNHILGLEVILPDGKVIRTGGSALDPPGYDLRGVIVGSEGTLGVVTEITVRILPIPEAINTMLAVYDDIAAAARSVSAIISAGIVPTTLEMMDAPIIKAVEDSYACGYPRDAAAVLIIEVEGPNAGLDYQVEQIRDLCMQNGCREIKEAKNEQERNRLWEGRRGAFGAVARLSPNYLVTDCTVPRTKLPEALEQVVAITKKYNLPHGNVFHAGDGNLHPLLLCDSRDTEQMHRVEKAAWEIMAACVRLGGTISGEHGIGVEKQDAMRMVFSPEDLDFQRDLKNAFDPQNVLNPGKIIPRPETDHQHREMPYKSGSGGAALNTLIQKVKTAYKAGQAILPVGGGSRRDYGNLSTVALLPLESTGLDEIIDYDPPNQVVTAGAGMTLENLQIELKRHNQWLPLRPPFTTNKHSLGGLVAAGSCGPERMFYGALRDHLLGLGFIDGKGQLISAGGRVVKNVAGYDITRLMTASAGTLGFITELTLKVATIPERCRALTAEGPLDACSQAARDIIKSSLWPTYVAAVPADSANADGSVDKWQVSIGFEGLDQTVESQLQRTTTLLEDGKLQSIDIENYDLVGGIFGAHYKELNRSGFVLRADFPIDRVVEFYNTAREVTSIQCALLDFGNGRMTAGVDEITDAAWHQMNEAAAELDGHVLLEKAPDDFKQHHDVFGRFRPEWKVMHTLKSVLDPGNIFAPGRLPGKK